jgi:hypothetical protein
MKLILALTVVAIASGCSSLPMQKAENNNASLSCDYAKMQNVDRAAQARVYMHIEWVHCPTLAERPKSVS